MSVDWEDFGIYDRDLPTDWQFVTSLDGGGGYDWITLHAFYSPSERRFYWASGAGCSCNHWGEDLRSPADFESGNKAALCRALRAFGDDNDCTFRPSEVIDAIADVRRFKGGAR